MNYQEALNSLYLLEKTKEDPGKRRIRRLLELLGAPQGHMKVFCLPDTQMLNVSAYLTGILKKAGYHIGCFHSKMILQEREWVEVSGKCIPQTAFAQGMEEIRKAGEQMSKEGFLSFSSLEVKKALAFWYFRKKRCEAVLLGDCFADTEELREIWGSIAFREELRGNVRKVRMGLKKTVFSCGEYENLEIGIRGTEQPAYAAFAMEAAQTILGDRAVLTPDTVREGLKIAARNGKFEILSAHPYLIADMAGTVEEIQILSDNICSYFPEKRVICLLGACKDTDCRELLQALPEKLLWIITTMLPEHDNCRSAYELALECSADFEKVTAADSPEEALEIAGLLAGKEDVILACGSFGITEKIRNAAGKILHKANQGK